MHTNQEVVMSEVGRLPTIVRMFSVAAKGAKRIKQKQNKTENLLKRCERTHMTLYSHSR